MDYTQSGGRRQVITASVESFRERIAVLQKELAECEEDHERFTKGIKEAKIRYVQARKTLKAKRLAIQDTIEKIDRIERNLDIAKHKLYKANRKLQENLETTRYLDQTSCPDLDELVQTIHKANKFAALMRGKKAQASQKVMELEEKIEKAERRYTKADDFIYTIKQKMSVHNRLMENPAVSMNYKPMKEDEFAQKVSAIKEKIRLAAARTRLAENQKAHVEKRMEIIENALDNYDRRINDFHQGKREIMGSK